jgi:hypothetical protein
MLSVICPSRLQRGCPFPRSLSSPFPLLHTHSLRLSRLPPSRTLAVCHLLPPSSAFHVSLLCFLSTQVSLPSLLLLSPIPPTMSTTPSTSSPLPCQQLQHLAWCGPGILGPAPWTLAAFVSTQTRHPPCTPQQANPWVLDTRATSRMSSSDGTLLSRLSPPHSFIIVGNGHTIPVSCHALLLFLLPTPLSPLITPSHAPTYPMRSSR